MKPMLWLNLMIIFSTLLLLFSILNFFNFLFFSSKKIKINFYNKNNLNLWKW